MTRILLDFHTAEDQKAKIAERLACDTHRADRAQVSGVSEATDLPGRGCG